MTDSRNVHVFVLDISLMDIGHGHETLWNPRGSVCVCGEGGTHKEPVLVGDGSGCFIRTSRSTKSLHQFTVITTAIIDNKIINEPIQYIC